MAGLACARRLGAAGLAVTLFDKGRKPGGRCATRHGGAFAFDHGAQYFTVKDDRFRDIVACAQGEDAARRWSGTVTGPAPSGNVADHGGGAERWVGHPGMSAFASHLARDLEIRPQIRIERIERSDDGWHLGAAERPGFGPFDTVVAAVPAPQAVPLLAAAPDLAERAAQASLAPCWAMMAGFAEPLEPLEPPYVAATVARGPLAWICNDSRKSQSTGERRQDAWVAHASPNWSRAHLEEGLDNVASVLLRAFGDALARTLPRPVHLSAHRWRFARVETPLGEPCLYSPGLGLGACGDWCLGPRIEAAYLSGLAMAERVLADA